MPVCRFCTAEFVAQRECVQHEILFHQWEPNFNIKCDFEDCPATFKVVSSYRSHKSRHKIAPENVEAGPHRDGDGSDHESDGSDIRGNAEEEPMEIDQLPADFPDQLPADLPVKELCGKFVLYVRANSNMPLGVLSNTIQHVESIVSASVTNYAKSLKESLVLQGVIPENFELPGPNAVRVFEGLHSVYMQDEYFENSLNIVKPQICALQGQVAVFGGSSGMTSNREVVLKTPQMVYIPVIETLECLLQDPCIQRLMAETQQADDGWYCSFVDGALYKESQFLKDHPDALRIRFYYDDLELCELLGSRTQSVGVMYMSLDNIPAKYRSKLHFIHLVAIAKKADIRATGMDVFLEPAVSDIKKLEKGIEISGKTVHGCLIAFTGDNLASHEVGGFKDGFLALHPCRTCVAPLVDVRTCTDLMQFVLRTEEAYQEQVRLLNEAPNQQRRSELSKEFGLNRETILNELDHFSVVKNLPPDAMHDLTEGCFPITIKILLSKVIRDGILTLAQINEDLTNWDYGYSEKKSKPAEILPQHLDANSSLRQSASEMWQLAVMLPLIIGPHMNIDCDYWNVYLSLLQVSMLVMSRKISVDMLGYLQVKLTEYAEGFLEHYRDTLIPKQHFLLHYVQWRA